MDDPRPDLSRAVERLLAALARDLDALAGLDAAAVLPVAASAHGTAAASIRSLDDCAAEVRIEGRPRRWELALRPLFFLTGDPARRLATLVHELLHLDPRQPGRLLEERRHRRRSHEAHEAHARALASSWLEQGDLTLLAPLGHHGEVLVRQWRIRPVEATAARRFTGHDVFTGPVLIRTPPKTRTVWW